MSSHLHESQKHRQIKMCLQFKKKKISCLEILIKLNVPLNMLRAMAKVKVQRKCVKPPLAAITSTKSSQWPWIRSAQHSGRTLDHPSLQNCFISAMFQDIWSDWLSRGHSTHSTSIGLLSGLPISDSNCNQLLQRVSHTFFQTMI